MTLISQLVDFFHKYFISPMQNYSGYNIVNTLTYGIILGIAVLFIFRLLKKLDIDISDGFTKALTPFIILGPTSRALVDAGVYPREYWSISPGIWITIGLSTLGLILIFKHILGKKWKKPFVGIGSVLVAINIVLIVREGVNLVPFVEVLIFFILVYSLIFGFTRLDFDLWYMKKLSNSIKANLMLFFAHIYDASTTFVGVDFHGYGEQHVLAGYLIELTGTAAVMYPLKLAFLIPVSLVLEELASKDEVDVMLLNLVKLAVFTLGVGPGTRNLLRAAMGV